MEIKKNAEGKAELKEKIKDEALVNEIISSIPSTESDDSIIRPMGYQAGSGYAWYWDWHIYKQVGWHSAWFYAEFVIINGGPDYIVPSGLHSPGVSGFGQISDPTLICVREREEPAISRYALAEMRWVTNIDLDTPWGGATVKGSTCYLFLGVGGDHYYVDNELPYGP